MGADQGHFQMIPLGTAHNIGSELRPFNAAKGRRVTEFCLQPHFG